MAFDVKTEWRGQFRTVTQPQTITLGGQVIARDLDIHADEPPALFGQDNGANPQELLLAALNSCMSVGYVAGAAMRGITLSKLEIRTKGTLDLRGFLGLDATVPAGYEQLHYEVTIAGNATAEQFAEIHAEVMRLSPNRFQSGECDPAGSRADRIRLKSDPSAGTDTGGHFSEELTMSDILRLRADWQQREIILPQDYQFIPSPEAQVERMMLDRVGGEQAIATSIVRYAPGSRFPVHEHGRGEEILVLEGDFCDESGEYPAGSYLRNPPGSRHAPYSRKGATIFVKLRQFHPQDRGNMRINTRAANWFPGLVPGLSVLPLHEFEGVNTALVRWAPDTRFNLHTHPW
jgi:anti-sigma factor ChrR (cupin superfamily)/uncharacterized OsmC-like protein